MRLEPADAFEATLAVGALASFRACLARADGVSLALRGQRVMPEPGAKIRARVADALAALMPVTVRRLYSARNWLGTTQGSSLIAMIDLDAQLRTRLAGSKEVFFSMGEWEDLAFYSSSQILLWTCTHEREGVVYGSLPTLRQLRLTPRPVVRPRLSAEPFDRAAEGEILTLVARRQ